MPSRGQAAGLPVLGFVAAFVIVLVAGGLFSSARPDGAPAPLPTVVRTPVKPAPATAVPTATARSTATATPARSATPTPTMTVTPTQATTSRKPPFGIHVAFAPESR